MAVNNRDRISKAFDLLSEGLQDVVDEVMTKVYGSSQWPTMWADEDARRRGSAPKILAKHDVQVQLRAITERGYEFRDVLSRAQQSFASELRETRNQWAHNAPFSSDDTDRALDTIVRLLQAVGSADSAADVRKMRSDLRRTVYEDQTRQQVKRTRKASLKPGGGLKPWREVIHPHDDVARGEFTASEFAADLHLVHTGQATSPEYGDPGEFFTRTYLTEGLRDLLSRALRRMSGDGNASPVVNLQTNFGGGHPSGENRRIQRHRNPNHQRKRKSPEIWRIKLRDGVIARISLPSLCHCERFCSVHATKSFTTHGASLDDPSPTPAGLFLTRTEEMKRAFLVSLVL